MDSQLLSELDSLASSLEQAVSLATTRFEHVRVTSHALRARRLAEMVRQLEQQESARSNRPVPEEHTENQLAAS